MNLNPTEIIFLILILSIIQNQKLDLNILNSSTPFISTKTIEFFSEDRYEKLTPDNVIYFTNKERKKYGLEELKKNEKLLNSSLKKAEDIIKYQTFAHILPDGKELVDILKENNYDPIVAGENLFIADYVTPKIVVEKLMQSPNHRENILNKKYKDIGVGIYKGIYKGKEMIVVVQHFGTSFDFCKKPDENLKNQIELLKKDLDKKIEYLNELKKEIDLDSSNLKEEKISKFNNLIDEYNLTVAIYKENVKIYNEQVLEFNKCIKQFE